MDYINNDLQVVSLKTVECSFLNLYEVLGIKTPSLDTSISFSTILVKKDDTSKSALIEVTVGFKMNENNKKEGKPETLLSLCNVAKFNISQDKITIKGDELEIEHDCLVKVVGAVINIITTQAKVFLDIVGFASINIPLMLDINKIILNNKQ